MSLRIQAYALAYTDMYSLAHRLYPRCAFTSKHPSQSQQSSAHTPQPCHLLSPSRPHPSSLLTVTLLLACASLSPIPRPRRCLLTDPLVQLSSLGTPNFSHASGKYYIFVLNIISPRVLGERKSGATSSQRQVMTPQMSLTKLGAPKE